MSENSAKDIKGGQGKDGAGLKAVGEFCKIINNTGKEVEKMSCGKCGDDDEGK